ncbi:MAG TPA: response regulator [Polyangiaceae bacterium]|nr:response regulator [Polyangiaceae bacterium]
MAAILIVEDDAIIAEDLRRTLIRLGYVVAGIARSSGAALDAVASTKPDLVLMDIKLKGAADGVQTVALLRAHSSLPVVYLTSHSDAATFERARATNPQGYLLKPFHEHELQATVAAALCAPTPSAS